VTSTRQPACRDHGDLAGHHHVRAAADAVDQALAAAIEVVELRLGHRVVDVDRREEELALLLHDVEPVHARGGLLRDAADRAGEFAEPALRLLGKEPLDQREEDLLLLGARLVEEGGVAALGAHAEMDEERGVAAIVQDHVGQAAIMPVEQAGGEIPILPEALALIGEDRDAGGGDGGGGVILRRVDVAGDPADVGAERLQGLDQHRRLDGHVQRAGDLGALQGLPRPILLAHRHQAGHLGLGDRDLLAAPVGEADVLDEVVGLGGGELVGGKHRGNLAHGRRGSCWDVPRL
jgi:hypothetical protein